MAFKLIPQGGPTLLAKPYSLIAKRGLFATKHLWVTPHKEEERYAAGDWVLQAEGGAGLQDWVKQVRLKLGCRVKCMCNPKPYSLTNSMCMPLPMLRSMDPGREQTHKQRNAQNKTAWRDKTKPTHT